MRRGAQVVLLSNALKPIPVLHLLALEVGRRGPHMSARSWLCPPADLVKGAHSLLAQRGTSLLGHPLACLQLTVAYLPLLNPLLQARLGTPLQQDPILVFGPPELHALVAGTSRLAAMQLTTPVVVLGWVIDPARAHKPRPVDASGMLQVGRRLGYPHSVPRRPTLQSLATPIPELTCASPAWALVQRRITGALFPPCFAEEGICCRQGSLTWWPLLAHACQFKML